jgi:undecaprenyl-diphosphatase
LDRLNKAETVAVDHNRWLSRDRPPRALIAVSEAAGGGRLWVAVAAVLACDHQPGRAAARDGVIAAAIASASTHIIAAAVRRRRPSAADVPAHQALIHKPTTSSFPSAHTAIAAAFTTAVAARHHRAGLLVAPVALSVAYSRLRMRAHWPTDVLAGTAWGVLIGVGVHRTLR